MNYLNLIFILLALLQLPLVYSAETDSSMILYIARSPNNLNWKTPSTLAKTLLQNSISGMTGERHITLGHVNYELNCSDEEPIYAGMHYLNKKEGVKLIFEDKTGLGLLFHNMAGRIDTKEDIEVAKKDFLNGKTSIITFKFSKEKCQTLKSYLQNYLHNGEQYNYGLNNNPFISISKTAPPSEVIKFTQNKDGIPLGAGCTAFVVSSLQELGILDLQSFSKWFSKVRVPEKYIGQFSDQIYKSPEEMQSYHSLNQKPGQKVSIQKIILSAHKWASPNEDGRELVYYSPNNMFSWVEEVSKNAQLGDTYLNGKITRIEKSPKNRSQQAYHISIELDKQEPM